MVALVVIVGFASFTVITWPLAYAFHRGLRNYRRY